MNEIPLISYTCSNCDVFIKSPNRLKIERKSIFDNKIQSSLNKKLAKKLNESDSNIIKSNVRKIF